MSRMRVARPTAVDDVYRCSWLEEAGATILPTGHQSFTSDWQWVLEPNDYMPIWKSLMTGGFAIDAVDPEPSTILDHPLRVSRLYDIATADAVYESRRREALNGRVSDTLNDLAITYGAAWVDVAAVLGVSVTALRKWRLGEARPRRAYRERLAAYVGCLAALRECGVEEPAGRLQVRLLDSYSITLAQLFEPDRVHLFLSYSLGDLSAVELLDAVSPDWRQLYRAQTHVYRAADGELSMRIYSER